MKFSKTFITPLKMVLLSLLFITCSKDDDGAHSDPQTLLAKSITSSQTATYSYDNTNRAIGYDVVFTDPVNNYSVMYTYNDAGQVTEVLYDNTSPLEDFKNVYFYNGSGQITKIEGYLASGGNWTLESESEAIYDTPGKVSVYQTSSGGTSYLNEEYVLDASGNTLEQLAYDTAGLLLVTTENSNFDDKKTASHSLPNTGFVRNVNNYGTVTVTVTGGSTSIGNFTYEYNSDGYPTKRTSSNGSIVTYEYIKK